MKADWEMTYVKSEPETASISLKATNKGEAYENAMVELDFFGGWATTPVTLGREIDGKAAHWLLTVLLRRNIVVSRKSGGHAALEICFD